MNFCVGVFVSFQLAVQPLSSLSTFVFFFFLRICIGTVVSSYCLLFSSFASSTLAHTTFCAALLYCFFYALYFYRLLFFTPKKLTFHLYFPFLFLCQRATHRWRSAPSTRLVAATSCTLNPMRSSSDCGWMSAPITSDRVRCIPRRLQARHARMLPHREYYGALAHTRRSRPLHHHFLPRPSTSWHRWTRRTSSPSPPLPVCERTSPTFQECCTTRSLAGPRVSTSTWRRWRR